MKRREFITLLMGAVARPLGLRAQVATKRPLIAWLAGGTKSGSRVFVDAFLNGMREFGYVDRVNFDITYRYSDGHVSSMSLESC